ncbi:MAG: hypothetical protein Q9214_002536, partial [Letrouitia sp. 1 TL-2023]
MVKHDSEKGKKASEVVSNVSLLVAAGTATVASSLPAAAYLLAMDSETLRRATSEVCSALSLEYLTGLQDVSSLKYLCAIIDEFLRLSPPAPEGLARKTSANIKFLE